MNKSHASRLTSDASRILVRGVNWLGDAVMSTPALLRLRERFPSAHITLLTPEKLRELWLHHPAVDEVVSFDDEGLFSVSRKLRGKNFELALVLPNSPRSAMEVWLARIPQRFGYSRPWRNWFLTHAAQARPGEVTMRKRTVAEIKRLIQSSGPARPSSQLLSAHHIHQYLHLAAALGANPEPLAPRLVIADDEIAAVTERFGLNKTNQGGRPLFALNPGAEYGPAKRWPIERFIEAAQEIQRRTNCVWLLLGGRAEVELAAQVASGLTQQVTGATPALNLAGQTSLRELIVLLKLSRVLLTNDTGPMHVAAALGTPVVVPFGSTSPELTGPGLPGNPRHRLLKSDAPCSPCFLRECPIDFRCMNRISVDRVADAVVEASRR